MGERIGEMKREGGITVVSLSRDDGQGRRGVTQDGSKWVFRPAGNDSPENWPDPRICVAHICGDTETRERVQCVITSRVSVRPAGISDDGLFHKSEIRDELDMRACARLISYYARSMRRCQLRIAANLLPREESCQNEWNILTVFFLISIDLM